MKPRNKNEREVEQLRHSLNSFNSPKRFRKSDWDWIKKNYKVGQTEYFAIYEVVGSWQVIRMFMYRSWSKKHEALHEPLRYWIKADGSFVIEAKNRQCLGNYYVDAWIWDSERKIRKLSNRDVSLLTANHVRIRSLLPELKRMGFRADNICVKNLMPFHLVRSLLKNNRLETFFKLHQTWLTWKFYYHDELTENLWQSIRVALRHGYTFNNKQEINDWCDMIHDLQELGLDTRSPHYICPANLQEAHRHWIERVAMKRRIERLQEMRKEVEAYEPTFYKNRHMFLDMVLTDGEIVIRAIPTAMGIKEEGEAMHHCVGGYYNKPNSLILSAKMDGKRVETIEVNLKTYTIIQSRGLQNGRTEYHDRIVALVEANLQLIRKLHHKKQPKKLKKAS